MKLLTSLAIAAALLMQPLNAEASSTTQSLDSKPNASNDLMAKQRELDEMSRAPAVAQLFVSEQGDVAACFKTAHQPINSTTFILKPAREMRGQKIDAALLDTILTQQTDNDLIVIAYDDKIALQRGDTLVLNQKGTAILIDLENTTSPPGTKEAFIAYYDIFADVCGGANISAHFKNVITELLNDRAASAYVNSAQQNMNMVMDAAKQAVPVRGESASSAPDLLRQP